MITDRDENGWRIPNKGTKSFEIYHLIRDGWTPIDIARIYGEEYKCTNTRILIYKIRNPTRANARSREYAKSHPEKRKRPKVSKQELQVRKLARVLEMTLPAARELELKTLERVK